MADKRISQLVDRGTVANNDVVPIVVSGATTTNKATISSIQTFMQGNLDLGVTSVGITLGSSGTDVSVTGSPITSSGNITINLPTASATNRGLLSAADWTTFNNKANAGNYVTLDTTQTITAQKTFTTSGSSDTMIISHGSGSGFALDVLKAGNGEAIRVTKSSGTGNAMTISGGNFEAGTIVKTGGTSSQYLMADGSVSTLTNPVTGTGAAGRVAYWDGSGSITSDSLFQWNDTFNRLGIGKTPSVALDVDGAGLFSSSVTASSLIRTGGTSSQFLKADGSVDSSSYALNSSLSLYLPLTGGTISGQLNVGSGNLRIAAEGASNITILRNFTGTAQGQSGFNHVGFNNSNNFYFTKNLNNGCIFSFNNTAYRTYTFPDSDATIASTSNLASYLPLAGGTLTGALNGTSASFTGGVTSSNNQNAPTTVNISNTTAGTGSQSTFSALSDSNAGVANFGKYSSLTTSYKILGSSSAFIYTDKGNISILNDNASGSILLAAGGSSTANLTIASTGAATFSSTVRINADGQSLLIFPTTTNSVRMQIQSTGGGNLVVGTENSTGGDLASGTSAYASVFSSGSTRDLVLGTNSVARLTINGSTGNVGIGTALPIAQLQIGNFSNAFADIQLASTTAGYSSILFGDGSTGTDSYRGYIQYQHGGDYMIFASSATERMRITSGGNVLFGTDSTPSGSVGGAGFIRESSARSTFFMASTTTGVATLVVMRNPNGDVGTIVTNGSSTSYNTSSDYRLKENVKPVDNALSVLTQLKPCTFNFIADSQEKIMGFIAHEVQEVMPQAVSGEKDGFKIEEVEVSPAEIDEEGNIITEAIIEEKEIPVYQGIDHSKLVPLLVAAIQELKTEIDSLKNQMQ